MVREDQRVSADRAVSALAWLRQFLCENAGPSESARETASLQPTATTVRTIERVRELIERRVEQHEAESRALQAEIRAHESLVTAWNSAGADVIRRRLDPDALAETDALADICAALRVAPGDVPARHHAIAAVSRVAQSFLQADDRVARRECALAEAHAVLRDAATQLRCGAGALADVTRDVEERDAARGEYAKTASTLREKAGQYEAAAAEQREKVRRSGVRRNTTHEAVAGEGERLRKLEDRLADIERQLEKYHALPPDTDACREMVKGMHAQIGQIEEEIENALNSMM